MREDVPAWPPGASRSTTSGAQSLRRTVNGSREAGRPAADDDRVVLGKARTRLQAQTLGKVARRGSTEQRPVGQAQHGAIVVRRARSGPARRQFRRVGRHPVEGDLVAREELAQGDCRRRPSGCRPSPHAASVRSAAMPCSPPMRSRASAPIFAAISGDVAAMA